MIIIIIILNPPLNCVCLLWTVMGFAIYPSKSSSNISLVCGIALTFGFGFGFGDHTKYAINPTINVNLSVHTRTHN